MLASSEIREKKMRLVGMAKIYPCRHKIVGVNSFVCHGKASRLIACRKTFRKIYNAEHWGINP